MNIVSNFRFIYALVLFLFIPNSQGQYEGSSVDNFFEARVAMVNIQLKQRGIVNENILRAFTKVKRHRFVPEDYLFSAYNDIVIPLGSDEVMFTPYISSLMISSADIKRDDKCLVVGTKTGYVPALLSKLCDEVYTIESNKDLADSAQKLFEQFHKNNVFLKLGDETMGWESNSPYDVIISGHSLLNVPTTLIQQLSQDGRIILPVGDYNVIELIRIKHNRGELMHEVITPFHFDSSRDELVVQ